MCQCSRCGSKIVDRACQGCGRKLPGPAKGAPNAGRPPSPIPREVRNARTLWIRLDQTQADAVESMLDGTDLDGAKLGRGALAAINRLRDGAGVEDWLRTVLGEDYERVIAA